MTTIDNTKNITTANQIQIPELLPQEKSTTVEMTSGTPLGYDTELVSGDEETKTEKAKSELQKAIDAGNVKYESPNIIDKIAGLIMDEKWGDYIVVKGIEPGTTLGEIKKLYNLPDGSLRHNTVRLGVNFMDDIELTGDDQTGNGTCQAIIYLSDLSTALDLSPEEIQKMIENK